MTVVEQMRAIEARANDEGEHHRKLQELTPKQRGEYSAENREALEQERRAQRVARDELAAFRTIHSVELKAARVADDTKEREAADAEAVKQQREAAKTGPLHARLFLMRAIGEEDAADTFEQINRAGLRLERASIEHGIPLDPTTSRRNGGDAA